MNLRILFAGAALSVAAFGTPADAACIGCGGTTLKGVAYVEVAKEGVFAGHALDASCAYRNGAGAPSTTSTGVSATLSGTATATAANPETYSITVSCSVSTSAGLFTTTGSTANYTGTTGRADAMARVPSSLDVFRICVSAEAMYAGETISQKAYCIDPGVGAGATHVPVEA